MTHFYFGVKSKRKPKPLDANSS